MPQIDYKEGDRVVCLWRGPWEDQFGEDASTGVPGYLGVYIASWFVHDYQPKLYVVLAEFPARSGFGSMFDATLFRRARETDISVFKSALAPRPNNTTEVERELA